MHPLMGRCPGDLYECLVCLVRSRAPLVSETCSGVLRDPAVNFEVTGRRLLYDDRWF